MARIKATCEDCGDVELQSSGVVARRCIETGEGSYRFACPQCNVTIIKEAAGRTVDLLVAAGVPEERWSLPVSLSDVHVGSLIDHDDIIEFHESMSSDAALAAAMDDLVAEFPTPRNNLHD